MEEQRFGFLWNCASANTFRKVKAAAGRKPRTFLISVEFINKLHCFYEREVTEGCMTFRWEPLGWMQLNVTPQKLSWDQSIVDTL